MASLISTQMDPLSITTAASSLAVAIFTASKYIHDFLGNAKDVDERVKNLGTSIDSLSTILQAMKNVFDTPGTQSVLKGAKDIGTLLGAVKTSIDDCMVTAEELLNIFEKISKEKGDSKTLLARGFRQFKLQNKQDEIDRINALLHTHKTNMHLSLQTVNVWVTAKAWQLQMDELRGLIKQMKLEKYDQDTVGANIAQHTLALQASAQFFVSRQTTIVANDDDDWMRISRASTGLSKNSSNSESIVSVDEVLDSDDEMEADLSVDLLEGGIELCEQRKYKEAEATLKNSIQDAMRKKLLDRHRATVKEAQLKLGIVYMCQEKFEAADPVLRGIAALPLDVKGMDDHLPLSLEASYYLAQISLAFHDFTTALRDCQKVVQERKKLYGRTDPRYIKALILRVLIQKTSGDNVSARVYAKQIPEEWKDNRDGIAVLRFTSEGMDMSVQDEKDAIKLLKENNPREWQSEPDRAMRWGINEGSINVVRLMLSRGVEVDASDNLYIAAVNGHADIVELLIQRGADVNKNFPKEPPLKGATWKDHADCAKILLDHGAKIDGENGETDESWSTIMTAAVHGSISCLRLLLDHGANPEVRNKSHNRTALMYAIRDHHDTCADMLLKAGANPNSVDTEGQCPLTFAIESRSMAVVRMIFEYGGTADLPKDSGQGKTPLYCACVASNLELARLLLQKGADPNHEGKWGGSSLFAASKCQKAAEMIKLLLEHGAKPNTADHGDRSSTPLYEVARENDITSVKLLLDAGADINQLSYGKSTPLSIAQHFGFKDLAEMLFERGGTLGGNAK